MKESENVETRNKIKQTLNQFFAASLQELGSEPFFSYVKPERGKHEGRLWWTVKKKQKTAAMTFRIRGQILLGHHLWLNLLFSNFIFY